MATETKQAGKVQEKSPAGLGIVVTPGGKDEHPVIQAGEAFWPSISELRSATGNAKKAKDRLDAAKAALMPLAEGALETHQFSTGEVFATIQIMGRKGQPPIQFTWPTKFLAIDAENHAVLEEEFGEDCEAYFDPKDTLTVDLSNLDKVEASKVVQAVTDVLGDKAARKRVKIQNELVPTDQLTEDRVTENNVRRKVGQLLRKKVLKRKSGYFKV